MLILHNLIPETLKDRPSVNASAVWKQHLQFSAGEWIKVTAPSGTGKTTLIQLIYGMRSDYTGTVQIGEKTISQLNPTELATLRQQQLSVVFQDLRLFPELTARENIELKRVLQEPCCGPETINEMAECLGISSILEQKAGICSYGEQQRICIIRALVQPFSWLIMDEPFSHLDLANKKIAAKLIGSVCKKNNAGFIITDLDDDDLFSYSGKLNL